MQMDCMFERKHLHRPAQSHYANSALVNCCNENYLGLIKLSHFISSDCRSLHFKALVLELANTVYCFYLLNRYFLGKGEEFMNQIN